MVIMRRHFGTSIGLAFLMMLLTFAVQAVVPFLVGLVWFSLASWMEDKARVLRAAAVLGAACLLVEVMWRFAIGPTIGTLLSFIPFADLILHFCLLYAAVMFVLEREVRLRLDASYGVAAWMTIVIGVAIVVGTIGVNVLVATAVATHAQASNRAAGDSPLADVPTFPGAQAEGQPVEIPGLGTATMYRTNSQSADEVAAYFKTEMPTRGWELLLEQQVGGNTLLGFGHQSRHVQIHVMANERPIVYMVSQTNN